jgi:hypothetical protein
VLSFANNLRNSYFCWGEWVFMGVTLW